MGDHDKLSKRAFSVPANAAGELESVLPPALTERLDGAAWLREDVTRKKLPPIVTIVVHHGEHGWSAPRRFHDLVDGLDVLSELRAFVPDFELTIDDPAGHDYGTVLRYIFNVVGEGPEQVVRRRLIELAPTFGEAMPSYDERLIERGLQQGLQQALLRVLRARFGAIDAGVESRVTAATSDEVERWLQRALDEDRIEAVFAD